MRLPLTVIFLLVALPLQAQDSTRVLPGIVVTAARDAAQAAPTGRTLVLDATAIRQTATSTVADLLTRRGGVFVRSLGPAGLASPSLRGTGAAQTLVLLDGFRLSDPQLGQVDLSLLPTALLERAEVLHGGASAWHGTDALGGVLALSSRKPGLPFAEIEGEAGAYGTRGLSAAAGGGQARRGWLAALTHRQSTGDFPFSTTATGRTHRRNADHDQTGLLLTGTALGMQGGAWLVDAERGLPGVAGTPPRGERQYDRTARLWLRRTHAIPHGTITGGVHVQAGTLRYLDPARQLDETGRTRIVGAEAEVRRAFGTAWLVGTGLSYGFSAARHPSLRADAHEQRGALFAYAEGTRGRLHVAPSLRVDGYATATGLAVALSPRLGVGYDLTPGLRGMMSGARAFRMPTFNDRFWQPGGNPDLHPEHGWMFDAGLRWTRGDHSAEITGFLNTIRDEIVWMPDAVGAGSSPINVGHVRTLGLELSARTAAHDLPGAPFAGFFYTYTDARDRSDPGAPAYGQPVRYVPREQARLYAGAGAGWFSFDAGLRYTGQRFARADGRDPLPPFAVAEVQVRLDAPAPGGRLTASAVIDNVLDARYSILQGYPMPPRHLRFRIGYRWMPR